MSAPDLPIASDLERLALGAREGDVRGKAMVKAAEVIKELASTLEEATAAVEAFEKNHGKAPTKRLHDAALRGRYALSNLRARGEEVGNG